VLDRLQKYFSERIAPADPADEAHRLRVATCALLLEAAHADDEFSEVERESLAGIVGDRFDLDAAETAELLELAEAERSTSGDLYQFARLINDTFPRARKLAILELLWQVVYSDGVLESHEDALMHRLGKLLGARHEELMALKLKVKRGDV
jgi:uncharacterized tellurite resistance protein B-like protein